MAYQRIPASVARGENLNPVRGTSSQHVGTVTSHYRPAKRQDAQAAYEALQQQAGVPADATPDWLALAQQLGGGSGGGGGGGGGGAGHGPPPDWARIQDLIRQDNLSQIAGLNGTALGARTAIENSGTQLDQALHGIAVDVAPQLRGINHQIDQNYAQAQGTGRAQLLKLQADLQRQRVGGPGLEALGAEAAFGQQQLAGQRADVLGTSQRYNQIFRGDAAARAANAKELTQGSLQDLAGSAALRKQALQQQLAKQLLDVELQKATYR